MAPPKSRSHSGRAGSSEHAVFAAKSRAPPRDPDAGSGTAFAGASHEIPEAHRTPVHPRADVGGHGPGMTVDGRAAWTSSAAPLTRRARTRSCSSAPPATSPTRKSFPRCRPWRGAASSTFPVVGSPSRAWTWTSSSPARTPPSPRTAARTRRRLRRWSRRLRYVDGDYNEPGTFTQLRAELQGCARPVHYLAIPPSMFPTVIKRLDESGCAGNARVIVEKPFGRDLDSARALNQTAARRVRRGVGLPDRSLTSARKRCRTCCISASPTRFSSRCGTGITSRTCRSRWPSSFGVKGRGKFYDETGVIRDVIQNHLFQVVSYLAMEAPSSTYADAIRDEQAKVLRTVRPMNARNIIRGQFRGYLDEPGVAKNSPVATYAALRLNVDSWRWSGVPFYVRAGKSLQDDGDRGVRRVQEAAAGRVQRGVARGQQQLRALSPRTEGHDRARRAGQTAGRGHDRTASRTVDRGSAGRRRSSATTSACSAMRSLETPRSSPVRTSSKRPGRLSTRCFRIPAQCSNTSRARGDPLKPTQLVAEVGGWNTPILTSGRSSARRSPPAFRIFLTSISGRRDDGRTAPAAIESRKSFQRPICQRSMRRRCWRARRVLHDTVLRRFTSSPLQGSIIVYRRLCVTAAFVCSRSPSPFAQPGVW